MQATLAFLSFASFVFFRADTAGQPSFEVASVKPSKADTPVYRVQAQQARFTATNVTLRELIRVAFGIQNAQLVGGPDWIGSGRFDVVANIGDAANPADAGSRAYDSSGPPDRVRRMLQSLLRERFNLATHTESRNLPIDELIMARTDRRLGPRLRPSAVDCSAILAKGDRIWTAPPDPPANGQPRPCDITGGTGRLTGRDVALSRLAQVLTPQVNRIVIDRTTLAGLFDFDLEWTPDFILLKRKPGASNEPVKMNGIDIDPNGPSLQTALREQLGLKLESSTGRVDVVVIDRVDQPMPD